MRENPIVPRASYVGAHAVAGAVLLSVAWVAACGTDQSDETTASDGGSPDPFVDSSVAIGDEIVTLTIDPPAALIESIDGTQPTQAFKAIAHYADGRDVPLTQGVTWTTG